MNTYTKQHGAATLITALVLLFVATLVVIFAARVGVQDQRISGNDYRAREAFAAAEEGLEQARTYIKGNTEFFVYENDLITCPDPITVPCSEMVAGIKYYKIPESEFVSPLNPYDFAVTIQQSDTGVLTVMSEGVSEDGSGNARVQEQYIASGVVTEGPVPPVMAVGIAAGGNFTAVGNPNIRPCEYTLNADGTTYSCVPVPCPQGVDCSGLISTWSESIPSLAGSLQTCYPGGYKDGTSGDAAQCIGPGIADDKGAVPVWNQCACRTGADGDAVSTEGDVKPDMHVSPVSLSPNPFDDVFDYVFHYTRASMHAMATEIENCDALDATSTGIFWVTGDCDINGATVGSRTAPVIVIVKGDLRLQANGHAWGLIVGIDGEDEEAPIDCGDPTDIAVVGTFSMHGALLSDCTLDLGAGTFNAIYDQAVFDSLTSNDEFKVLAPIAGTWRDF